MKIEYMFRKLISIILIFTGAAFILSCNGKRPLKPSERFGAYYTHIVTGDEFEKISRTGDYADIIIDFGEDNGKFVFWRGSSYLPYWETPKGKKFYIDEVIPRSGDGNDTMPDKVNSFSTVKIIENENDRVVIHWRYLPDFGGKNPHTGISAANFTDEYFIFSPGGAVVRTIRQGTSKYDDWADPELKYTQTFNLGRKNIINKNLTQPSRSVIAEKKAGRPIIAESIVKPVAWYRFDEGIGDTTFESITKAGTPVGGSKTFWRQGVSGTSLQFDDVSTFVSFPATVTPKPEKAITLEGWISIAAYPWNWCPIVQQADDVPEELDDNPVTNKREGRHYEVNYKKEDDRGYFLGIDGHGHPGLKIRVGGNWEELTSSIHLERRLWYHLTGTYDMNSGKMAIYVNGKPAEGKKVMKPGVIELSSKKVMIGKGKNRRQIDPVRASTFPGSYSFDGLLDEVKIYDIALTTQEVSKTYGAYSMSDESLAATDIPPRALPAGDNIGTFGAQYSALKYFDTWDNLFRFSKGADVTVSLGENPSKFVFWRGVSYIPMIVNEKGVWYSNEFNETWNKSGGHGCQEPMSDKGSYFSHVRILENTPARVVVHWRFALTDVEQYIANYDEATGWGDWSDWYYYIYPDGIAAKQMHLWTNGERNHEWHESMIIMGPEQHPHGTIERKSTITMIAEDGNLKKHDWITTPPENINQPENANILLINLTGEYDPVTISTGITGTRVYRGEITPYAVFANWNHWPIAQMPSDGRYASYPDRTSHSSLCNLHLPVYREEKEGNKPFYEKILLEGMWNKKPEELMDLSKSWTQAPGLTGLKGAEGGYAPEQRAYVLKTSAYPVTFTVNASTENPVYNLCFVLKGWNSKDDAKVTVEGNVKQGTIRDTDGTFTKVIYIEAITDRPMNVEIGR